MALFLAALFGLFLCLTGLVFIISPAGAVAAFGIDPSHMADLPLAPAVGVRQIALGLAVFLLALRRQSSSCGSVLLIASLVPLADFMIAGQAFGYTSAVHHLVTVPMSLVLGLILAQPLAAAKKEGF
jgi:hypothetical protein